MKITLNQKSALFSAFVVSLFIILCLLFLFLFVNFFFKRLTNDNNSFELSPDELLNEQWTQIKENLIRLNPNKPYCSLIPPYNLTGFIQVHKAPNDFSAFNDSIFSNISNNSLNLAEWKQQFARHIKQGGQWEPPECHARHRLAIIIPYRDRLENLNGFLYHMHPFLQRQQIAYRVFVVEQEGNGVFNKGILMNTGFIHALNLSDSRNYSQYLSQKSNEFPFDCVTFHDVDLLPEDDRILYTCPPTKKPRHLSVAVDKFNYELVYYGLIGGVLNFPFKTFLRVNGYSNLYWGWGNTRTLTSPFI